MPARLQRSGGKLPIRDAVQLIASLTDILSSAHLHGVIHRDIKPSNVMLRPRSQMPSGERVKLIDFGMAKLAPSPLASHNRTPRNTYRHARLHVARAVQRQRRHRRQKRCLRVGCAPVSHIDRAPAICRGNVQTGDGQTPSWKRRHQSRRNIHRHRWRWPRCSNACCSRTPHSGQPSQNCFRRCNSFSSTLVSTGSTKCPVGLGLRRNSARSTRHSPRLR